MCVWGGGCGVGEGGGWDGDRASSAARRVCAARRPRCCLCRRAPCAPIAHKIKNAAGANSRPVNPAIQNMYPREIVQQRTLLTSKRASPIDIDVSHFHFWHFRQGDDGHASAGLNSSGLCSGCLALPLRARTPEGTRCAPPPLPPLPRARSRRAALGACARSARLRVLAPGGAAGRAARRTGRRDGP